MTRFCEECDGNRRKGHEPWCSLDTAKQQEWLAITDSGRKLPFTMGPSVTAQFALNYAQTHRATFGLDSVPESVIDVEKVK